MSRSWMSRRWLSGPEAWTEVIGVQMIIIQIKFKISNQIIMEIINYRQVGGKDGPQASTAARF